MNHRKLGRTFLEFFAQQDHKMVASSSLIPKDDPSLLFTGAGMVRFRENPKRFPSFATQRVSRPRLGRGAEARNHSSFRTDSIRFRIAG
jgi:hypothetical protein